MSEAYDVPNLYSTQDAALYDAMSLDSEDSAVAPPQATYRQLDAAEDLAPYDEASPLSMFSPDSVDDEPSPAEATVYASTLAFSDLSLLSPDSVVSADSYDSEESPEELATKYRARLRMEDAAHYATHANEMVDSMVLARMIYDAYQQRAVTTALRDARNLLRAQNPGAEAMFIERMAARLAIEYSTGGGLQERADAGFRSGSGWTQEEIDRHIHGGEPLSVEYLDAETRKEFTLTGGPAFTLGTRGVVADTQQMWSKHSGAGWGIFVMDADGTIYIENHKMAMFHHSSFMAGGAVACAGEIQVVGGNVVGITNKSGHYMPSDEDMVSMLRELVERGVNVSAVTFTSMTGNYSCTGQELLTRLG